MSSTPLHFPRLPEEGTSDKSVLAIAFAVGIFICLLSAVANAGMLGIPNIGRVLCRVNTAGEVIAILLVWRLLRWSRERHSLIRERAKVIVGLNHEIRNAIQAISLSEYDAFPGNRIIVNESMARIERALDEYVPSDLTLRKHSKGMRL
jgi:hypothetical protein